jgi:predicted DCC family thiol-disulfide oxidoreductase YuxK
VNRWRKHTKHVKYAPYQQVAEKYAAISREEFQQAAHLIESKNGRAYRAAAAVFKLWTYRSRSGKMLWFAYRYLPLFRPMAEQAYRFVARHRPFFWAVTKLFWRNAN